MGSFVSCCNDRNSNKDREETQMILEEYYDNLLRHKINKKYRLNSFHNFGSKRQLLLEFEYIETNKLDNNKKVGKLSVIKFLKATKQITKIEKVILDFTYSNLEKYLNSFENYDVLFLNIIMFVLSNTKNNFDKKQETISTIINCSFFEEKDATRIDINKLKELINNLIFITLSIFINVNLLQAYESKENIFLLFDQKTNFNLEMKFNKYNINSYVFYKINQDINKNYTFETLINLWEEYLMHPILFAGYSHDKIIENYNLKLKEELSVRLINLFDNEKIVNSIVKFKI